jgi:hypothetical protein
MQRNNRRESRPCFPLQRRASTPGQHRNRQAEHLAAMQRGRILICMPAELQPWVLEVHAAGGAHISIPNFAHVIPGGVGGALTPEGPAPEVPASKSS